MKRKDKEDFEKYRERRKKENKETKQYLKGRLFWDSKNYGTYYK